MPRTTRELALRELAASVNNIEWAEKHILKVIDRYLDDHPEIAVPLWNLISVSKLLKESVAKVRGSI